MASSDTRSINSWTIDKVPNPLPIARLAVAIALAVYVLMPLWIPVAGHESLNVWFHEGMGHRFQILLLSFFSMSIVTSSTLCQRSRAWSAAMAIMFMVLAYFVSTGPRTPEAELVALEPETAMFLSAACLAVAALCELFFIEIEYRSAREVISRGGTVSTIR